MPGRAESNFRPNELMSLLDYGRLISQKEIFEHPPHHGKLKTWFWSCAPIIHALYYSEWTLHMSITVGLEAHIYFSDQKKKVSLDTYCGFRYNHTSLRAHYHTLCMLSQIRFCAHTSPHSREETILVLTAKIFSSTHCTFKNSSAKLLEYDRNKTMKWRVDLHPQHAGNWLLLQNY